MTAFEGLGWLIVQAAATLFMTGLIWFVQVVHYPLFASVGVDGFARYEQEHTRRTGWVVGPPMLVEIIAATVWVELRPDWIPAWQVWVGLGLVVLIWMSTAALQVPQHRRLSVAFDGAAQRMLVATNWIRVVGWSLRAALVLYWVSLVIAGDSG